MTMCGRTYRNPANHSEIWLNVGWNMQGLQRYPPWEQGLLVSELDFRRLLAAVQAAFRKPPYVNPNLPVLSMYACMCTFGLCFCPCVYLKGEIVKFNDRLFADVAEVSKDFAFNARVEVIEEIDYGANWIDSRGEPLLFPRKYSSQPGGPPMGYNIVLTLPNAPEWPLSGSGAPVQAQMKSQPSLGISSELNPPNTVGDCDDACKACGRPVAGDFVFCPGCGHKRSLDATLS